MVLLVAGGRDDPAGARRWSIFPRSSTALSSSPSSRHVLRLAAGAAVAVALSLSPWTADVRVRAQQQSGKQALLTGVHRLADAPEVLRTGQRRGHDASMLPYMPGHIVVKFSPA